VCLFISKHADSDRDDWGSISSVTISLLASLSRKFKVKQVRVEINTRTPLHSSYLFRKDLRYPMI
jgi:hypothetical protein